MVLLDPFWKKFLLALLINIDRKQQIFRSRLFKFMCEASFALALVGMLPYLKLLINVLKKEKQLQLLRCVYIYNFKVLQKLTARWCDVTAFSNPKIRFYTSRGCVCMDHVTL